MNNSLLPKWLKNNQPPSAWLVCGDEPLQLSEALVAITQHAKEHGCDERVALHAYEAGFQWRELVEQCARMSLFASKRLVEVKLGSRDPGSAGSAAIKEALQRSHAGLVLLFSFEKHDGRTKRAAWYKALADCGEVVAVAKVSYADLPKWLVARASMLNFKLGLDAAEWIADRTEGNMLAAVQELNLLAMSGCEAVGLSDILSEIRDSARFNVFDLLQQACMGNVGRAIRMLRGLRDEGAEPVAILGALLWELRRLCVVATASAGAPPGKNLLLKSGIYGDRQKAAAALIGRGGLAGLHQLMAAALQTDRVLKSGDKERAWRSINWLFVTVCVPGSRAFPE